MNKTDKNGEIMPTEEKIDYEKQIIQEVQKINLLKRQMIMRPDVLDYYCSINPCEKTGDSLNLITTLAPTQYVTKSKLVSAFQKSPWLTVRYHAAMGLELSKKTLELILWDYANRLNALIVNTNDKSSEEYLRWLNDFNLLKTSMEHTLTKEPIEEMRKYNFSISDLILRNTDLGMAKEADNLWNTLNIIMPASAGEKHIKTINKNIFGFNEKQYAWTPLELSDCICFSNTTNQEPYALSKKYKIIYANNAILKSIKPNDLIKEVLDVQHVYALIDLHTKKTYSLTSGDESKVERDYFAIMYAQADDEGIFAYSFFNPHSPQNERKLNGMIIADWNLQKKYLLEPENETTFSKEDLAKIISAKKSSCPWFDTETHTCAKVSR